jgi:hypothetical protein
MAVASKSDLYKEYAAEYRRPRRPALIHVGEALYLTVDGGGPPGSPDFEAAIGALYGVAYTLKFAYKAEGKDYRVSGLEGLWWPADRPEDWRWKVLIRVPAFITQAGLRSAQEQLAAKKPGSGGERVRLETINEGDCVQVLYTGPYDQETATIEAMHRYAQSIGRVSAGPHHELYLSDPRRVPPEKLRTILRHPVQKAVLA